MKYGALKTSSELGRSSDVWFTTGRVGVERLYTWHEGDGEKGT